MPVLDITRFLLLKQFIIPKQREKLVATVFLLVKNNVICFLNINRKFVTNIHPDINLSILHPLQTLNDLDLGANRKCYCHLQKSKFPSPSGFPSRAVRRGALAKSIKTGI